MTILELDPPQTPRDAIARVMLALMHLVEVLQIEEPPKDLSINFDGRSARIDLARLDADGHIDYWIAGYHVDPHDLSRYGQPVALPFASNGPMH